MTVLEQSLHVYSRIRIQLLYIDSIALLAGGVTLSNTYGYYHIYNLHNSCNWCD